MSVTSPTTYPHVERWQDGGGHDAKLGTGMLMCRRHWRMVPQPLRAAVWAAWSEFRENPTGSPESLFALRRTQRAAIQAVDQYLTGSGESS